MINKDWIVGTTFAPFNQTEYDYLAIHNFTYRCEPIKDNAAQSVVDQNESLLLLLDNANDPIENFDVSIYRPYFEYPNLQAIELGNELNLEYKHRPATVNQFYHRAVNDLRNNGYTGNIITAGIMNLNNSTLRWAEKTIKNLPPDIIFGWHAYDDWREQLRRLQFLLKGRRHAMTVSGSDIEDDEMAAEVVEASIELVYQSGSLSYIHYQTHDGPPDTELNHCGLKLFGDETGWRDEVIDMLSAWSNKSC